MARPTTHVRESLFKVAGIGSVLWAAMRQADAASLSQQRAARPCVNSAVCLRG
jgi:hypothetical protein